MIQRPKLRTCKWCRQKFSKPVDLPFNSPCCCPECGASWGEKVATKTRKAVERDQAKQTRAQREAMKTLPQLKAEAQREFNKYCRLRDLAAGYPCICCDDPFGEQKKGGTVDAGHYRSVGSAPHLRFDERNCHAQKAQHNRHGAGNAVDYRIGLIDRIGLEAVEALEADNVPRHYTKDDLRYIRALYRAKARELMKHGGGE